MFDQASNDETCSYQIVRIWCCVCVGSLIRQVGNRVHLGEEGKRISEGNIIVGRRQRNTYHFVFRLACAFSWLTPHAHFSAAPLCARHLPDITLFTFGA